MFFLLALVLYQTSSAQDTTGVKPAWINHATISYGFNFNRTYDQRMAERSYYGAGIDVGLGDRWVRPRAWHEYEVLATGIGAAPLSIENFLTGGLIEGSYRYLQRIDLGSSPWRWHLGLQAGGFYNGRFHSGLGNSSVHMEWTGYIGPLAQVAREAKIPLIKGQSTIAARIHMPLFSYVGRLPAYALPGFDAPAHYFRPIGGFNRIKTEITLTRPRGNGNPNLFQVGYVWDFYGMNEGQDAGLQRLRWATHSLRFVVLIRKRDIDSVH